MAAILAEIDLETPIDDDTSESGKRRKIILREPTTGDILQIGQPVELSFTETGAKGSADHAVLTKYLVACTGMPKLILDQLEQEDLLYLLSELEVFFTEKAILVAERLFAKKSREQSETSA